MLWLFMRTWWQQTAEKAEEIHPSGGPEVMEKDKEKITENTTTKKDSVKFTYKTYRCRLHTFRNFFKILS